MAKKLLCSLLAAASLFLGGFAAMSLYTHSDSRASAQVALKEPVPQVTDVVAIGDRFELVARKVSPAVVYVEASKPSEKEKSKMTEESGSGVIVRWERRKDYLVFTNNHVVSGAAANRVVVHLADGRVFRAARVWTDPETDVAVLSLDVADELPTAALGDSDKLKVGHWVLAIGSPFGLNQTVTHGILSARERGQVSLGSTIRIKDFLQTDASINPGSSGGPLVNLDGEVIGINTAIASPSGSNTGVSFSIPINLFKRIAGQLLEFGRVTRGYLGVQLSDSFEPKDALRLGLDRVQGALVEEVHPNTPAAQAGLKPGDVILEADGVAVRNENHLINLVANLPVNKSIALVVWRDGRKVTLQAVVGDWSKAQEQLKSPR